MHPVQSRYAVALAHLEAIRATIREEAPMPSTDDEAVFEAWLTASELVETRLGLYAAERAVTAAEDAMVRWALPTAVRTSPRHPGGGEAVAVILSRWPRVTHSVRTRVVDLAFRLSA